MNKSLILAPIAAVVLAACATVPTGPSVMALPGSERNFDQFMVDDAQCRDFASRQVGGAASENNNTVVKSATIGTVIGALAGAAIGGRDGAGIGAGMGLLTGASVGSNQGRAGGYGTQRQYDNAYVQCMYARGHKVPVQGVMTESRTPTARTTTVAPPPPPPPPPPGTPPPPPPGR